MASHVVTSPLVITKKEDGTDLYLYQGAQVPGHVKGDELKRLKDEGHVEAVSDSEAADSKPSSSSN